MPVGWFQGVLHVYVEGGNLPAALSCEIGRDPLGVRERKKPLPSCRGFAVGTEKHELRNGILNGLAEGGGV
jgi:hypothetical protein